MFWALFVRFRPSCKIHKSGNLANSQDPAVLTSVCQMGGTTTAATTAATTTTTTTATSNDNKKNVNRMGSSDTNKS